MEKQLPFIASIISGIVTVVATAWFMQEYLGFATILVVLAIVILRFNGWALIGCVLFALAVETFNKGAFQEFTIVFAILIIGTLLQLGAFAISGMSQGMVSSVAQNIVFAMIGLGVAYSFYFASCDATAYVGPEDVDNPFLIRIMQVDYCRNQFVQEPLTSLTFEEAYEWPTLLNAGALICLRGLLWSPTIWAALFAAVRAVGFNISDTGRLLVQTVKAFVGSLIGGLLCLILAVPIVYISTLLSPTHPVIQTLALIFFTVYIFITVVSTGWGAQW